MLYTYGVNNPDFKEVTKDFIFDYFRPKPEVEYDCESDGLDHLDNEMICFQLGDRENQFVIHKDKLMEFKIFLQKKKLIGHNIKFDLKFLYKYGIYPTKVYDTFLAERVLTNGFDVFRGLKDVAKKYCNVDLDKSIRDGIAREGLTTRVIQYSGDDVRYLSIIKEKQLEEAEKQGVTVAIDKENEYVLALAYIENCGFTVNKEAWMQKMKTDEKNLSEAALELDKYILDNKLTKYISPQLDLFGGGRSVQISWASSHQVVKLFEDLQIPVEVTEKGKTRKTVEAKHIAKYAKKYPIVKPYIKYKELEKVVSTYGENFLTQIRPDGRIYTKFTQLMDTGRTSSGGREMLGRRQIKRINFQNIPSNQETRDCFIAGPGNRFIVSDYSSQEKIILANRSLDPNLIEFYSQAKPGDLHSFVASNMYPEIKEDYLTLDIEEFKKKHGDKRYNAKTASFAIDYGGTGKTIADNNDLEEELGNAIYNAYFEAFPGLKDYFSKMKQQGLKNGFILISEITGRKCYVEDFEEYQRLQKEINRSFWDKWKMEKYKKKIGKETPEYEKMRHKISRFFKIKGEIERMSLNYPTQGQAGEITKAATVLFFNWIKENNLLWKVLIPNTVHDEIIAEAPTEIAEWVKENLQRCMEEAGLPYCQTIKLKAEPNISTKWKK